jgi:addiction module HigA family antidote
MALAWMRRAPTHPGVILADRLEALGLTQANAATRMGVSRAQLNHVRTGTRPMPMTLCVKVAALTGTSAEFWATLQMRFDLWHAMRDKATAAAARRIAAETA